MAGYPSGHDGQRAYSYNDGNTQVTYSSQHFSYNSTQQGNPQLPSPQMLPTLVINQLHQQHMNLHHAGMQSAMQMHQNMLNMAQPFQAQQSTLMHNQARPQFHYTQSSPAQLPQMQGQQMQIEAAPQNYSDESDSEDDRAAERDRQLLGVAQDIQDRMHRSDREAQQRMAEQARRDAARKAQHNRRQQEQAQSINNLTLELKELRANLAAQQQQASPAIDMQALQRMIQQRDGASRDETKKLIDDAVGKQLSGVATPSDLGVAAKRMQRALHDNAYASNAQVEDIEHKEVANIVNEATQKNASIHRPRIESSSQRPGKMLQSMPSRVETQFTVEEIPEDEDDTRKKSKSRSKGSRYHRLKALPAPEAPSADFQSHHRDRGTVEPTLVPNNTPHSTTGPSSALLIRIPGQTPTPEVFVGNHSKSKRSIAPTDHNAMVPVKHSKHRSRHAPKSSTLSVPPTADNALVGPSTRDADISTAKPHRSSKMSTVSVQPSESIALVRSKTDVPRPSPLSKLLAEESIQPSLPAEGSLFRRSKSSTVSVQPSDQNALVRQTSDREPQERRRSSKRSAVSIQPCDNKALVRAGGDEPRHVVKGSTFITIRPRNDRRGESKNFEVVSEEPQEISTALVRQSEDVLKKPSR